MSPRVVVLTDRSQLPLGRSLTQTLAAAAGAGLTHVVLRELDLAPPQRADLARHLGRLGLVVVAAHRPVDGAVGVHLPEGAPPPGPGIVWGRSCHDRDAVRCAAADGAGWATLSPYAASASKPGHGPALDPTAYAGLPLPTYALGGITPTNAAAACASGAHGVAVMGAVMRADDPAAVVAALLREVRR